MKKSLSPVCQNMQALIQTLSHVDTDTIQTMLDAEPRQPMRMLYLYMTFTNATMAQINYIKQVVRVSPGDFEGEAQMRTETLAYRYMTVCWMKPKDRADLLHHITHNTPPLVRQAFVLEAQERNFRTQFRSKAARALLDAIEAMD